MDLVIGINELSDLRCGSTRTDVYCKLYVCVMLIEIFLFTTI